MYRSPTHRIYTRIYHKPTYQKQYLHFPSAHPMFKRICPLWPSHQIQKTTILKKKLKNIYNQLKYRKYPADLLHQAIQQVSNMDRFTLLRLSPRKKPQNNIRLITNYIPRNPNLLHILKKCEGLLLMTRKPAIKPNNIQVTYSRSPNLKDMLVKSEVYLQP